VSTADPSSPADAAPGGAGYLEVEISRAGGGWDPAAEEIVLRTAQAAFAAEHPDGVAEVSVLLADDAFVQTLNRKYRGKDRPTNVLSFPQAAGPADAHFGEPRTLGDVVLAYETVKEEARDQGKAFDAHLAHLVVHGMLHLMGYDHQNEQEAADMEELERTVLARFGIADPYADAGTDGEPEEKQ
jgi:probable rRNA maturation factor